MDYRECTADEWLLLAIDAEAQQKACGVFDPAYEHFVRLKANYLALALQAEKASG